MTCSSCSLVVNKITQRVSSTHGDVLAKTGRLCSDSRSWHNTIRAASMHSNGLGKTCRLCIDIQVTVRSCVSCQQPVARDAKQCDEAVPASKKIHQASGPTALPR